MRPAQWMLSILPANNYCHLPRPSPRRKGSWSGALLASIGGQSRNRIARLSGTTGLADSFNPNPNSNVFCLAVQPDGKVLVGGAFTSIGGQTRNRMARLDGASGLADSLDPNGNNSILAIVVPARR